MTFEPIVLGDCTIYQSDCLEIMPTLEPASVHAIITDLPYGQTSCNWDAVIPFVPMWENVKRLLKPRGVFVTTASQPFTSMLVMSNLKSFRHAWVWDKVMVSGMGAVKYIPLKTHEDIVVFAPSNCVYNPQMSGLGSRPFGKLTVVKSETNARGRGIDITKARFGKGYPKTILCFPRPNNLSEDGLLHPTQKPVSLYEYLIRTYTNEGDTVLDICFGSCTTGIACLNTGRKFIGIEKDERYFKIGVERMAKREEELHATLFSCGMTDTNKSDCSERLPLQQLQIPGMVDDDERE